MSVISWIHEFPLAVCELLLLAPLQRTPLQKILFPSEAVPNNSVPYRSGLKIEGFHFLNSFYNHIPFSNVQ